MFRKKLTTFQSLLLILRSQAGAINPATGLEDPDYVPEDDKPGADGKYPKAFVDKLLREKNNHKKAADDLKAELDALKKAPPKKEGNEGDDAAKALLRAKDEENKLLKDQIAAGKAEKQAAMKLGTLKQEFDKNGGNAKQWELVESLAKVDKILIDEDTGIVYGAESEIKRIKELAPTFFGKAAKGTEDGDHDQNNKFTEGDDDAKKKAIDELNSKRLKKTKDGKNPLIDFYAAHNMLRK